MKSKYVVLASFALISVSAFAQKDEIKSAEKALKKGNASESISLLQTETLIANSPEDEKAHYYFVKGNAYLELAKATPKTAPNLLNAAKAYEEMVEIEKKAGASKYTSQAQASITDLKSQLFDVAVVDIDKKNYKEATSVLYNIYKLDPKDQEKLYYAANTAIEAKDYDLALSYYETLKAENYTGEGTGYYAVNIVTEKEDFFGSTPQAKIDRDSRVKAKVYNTPRDEKIPSKKGEIYRNIALILTQQGKNEEAKKALADAVAANPDDTSLLLAQADFYLKEEDYTSYKNTINQILAKNPNDADLIFNLGVISSKTDKAAAENYYKKAIEIKPDYINAYLNLSILMLDQEKAIIDEMNALGTSDKDNKRYEVLKNQRNDIFRSVLPYLEKANALDPKNEDVANTLLNVYGALEMSAKKKELKAKMEK